MSNSIILFFVVQLAIPAYCQHSDAQKRKDSLSRIESFKDIDIGPSYCYVIDGLIISQETFNKLHIPSSDIQTRRLVSKDEGVRLFGEKGKNGAKVFATKKIVILNKTVLDSKNKEHELRLIDESGIRMIRNIDAVELKSEFGVRNKSGAIVIETK